MLKFNASNIIIFYPAMEMFKNIVNSISKPASRNAEAMALKRNDAIKEQ